MYFSIDAHTSRLVSSYVITVRTLKPLKIKGGIVMGSYGGYGGGYGGGFALIVVLFILLIIVGAAWL